MRFNFEAEPKSSRYSSGVARGQGASAPGAKVGGAKMSKTFKTLFINC